jgi:hypothetical protein
MARRKTNRRELRHGASEENLFPEKPIPLEKRGGKSFSAGLDRLLAELPSASPACFVNLSEIIDQDRE